MIELPLVFLGGLLGSAHCVGMCGGFALSIGISSRGFAANLGRQLVYTSGRIFTYSFFGVVAGYMGLWLASRAHWWLNAQAALSLVAGVLLAGQGLLALGWVPRHFVPKGATGGSFCLAGTFVGQFLMSPRWSHVLLAGVFTGFLPCGLVYGFLALASSSASVWDGLLTMSLFGAGTAPLMILAGTGSALLSYATRRSLLNVSAVCVSLTGLISIARGILFIQTTAATEVVRCLLCGTSG
jgi:sulfite exporter TauE/SafE